jgi:hypothetical protein
MSNNYEKPKLGEYVDLMKKVNTESIENQTIGGVNIPKTIKIMSPITLGMDYMNKKKKKENLSDADVPEDPYFIEKALFTLFISLVAAILAWDCNDIGNSFGGRTMQILYTIFAFLFGGLYLVYYIFVHIIGDSVLTANCLPSSCPSSIIEQLKETQEYIISEVSE